MMEFRDLIAVEVMKIMLKTDCNTSVFEPAKNDFEIAYRSYQLAGAMIIARNGTHKVNETFKCVECCKTMSSDGDFSVVGDKIYCFRCAAGL